MRRNWNIHVHLLLHNFNPRTPYGMRLMKQLKNTFQTIFQSTHPLRDVTLKREMQEAFEKFQSTHPLRDATEELLKLGVDVKSISIHAPLTGCDYEYDDIIGWYVDISIHAPLTGCDRLY